MREATEDQPCSAQGSSTPSGYAPERIPPQAGSEIVQTWDDSAMRRPNWTPAEDAILREHYGRGEGPVPCQQKLPMRTYDCIVQRACKLGLTVKRVHTAKPVHVEAKQDKANVAGPCYCRGFKWGFVSRRNGE